MLPERVTAGLLAFDTGQGLAYAEPSFRQRVHLLWTFRNFRRLSTRVLNSRQQHLIESLYSRRSINVAEQPRETVLIGIVEDISLMSPSPVLVADAIRKKEEVSEGNVPPEHNKPHYVSHVFSGGRLIFAGALCVVIVILAWHQWRAQPISFAWNARNVTTVQRAANAVATEKDAKQAIEPLSTESRAIPASQTSNAERTISSPIRRLSAAESRESRTVKVSRAVNKRDDAANPPAGHKTQEEALRPQISGAPLRLTYPTYPQTSVHGKVSLKAVIGYDGTVQEVKVLTGNKVLAAAAIRAIRQWRYDPYHKDGKVLEAEANITVSFIARDVIAINFPTVP